MVVGQLLKHDVAVLEHTRVAILGFRSDGINVGTQLKELIFVIGTEPRARVLMGCSTMDDHLRTRREINEAHRAGIY